MIGLIDRPKQFLEFGGVWGEPVSCMLMWTALRQGQASASRGADERLFWWTEELHAELAERMIVLGEKYGIENGGRHARIQ